MGYKCPVSSTNSAYRIIAGLALTLLGLVGPPAWGWTCPQTISTPSCGLWQSPNDNNEVPDQESLGEGGGGWASPKLGQTFKVGGNGNKTLYRLDVILGNNEDQRSGVLKIWTWKTNYAQTVATTPIFNDAVDLTGLEKYQLKSFYPRITVKGNTTYLFEFDSTGRDGFPVVGGTTSTYANGQVFGNGVGNTYDLWFRTFLPPSGSPILPTFASSDPPQWTPPLVNTAPVTKEDYYTRVKNLADNQRCDGLLGCGFSSKVDALYEAFLYRSCQEHSDCGTDHVGNAVTMLKRAERWFRCSPAPVDDCNCVGCGPSACGTCVPGDTYFASMEKAELAYFWLQPAWGSISQADHILIRNMFLDSARNLWSQRELGTLNRAFAYAVTYRIVLALAAMSDPYPGMPDPTPTETSDWEAYASGVWNDIWTNRDAEEDSEGYSIQEWFRYFLEYTSVAGLETMVWQDPAFLAWVDRIYHQFTPLGVAPDYGHGGGWADQNSAPIWLFEKAASMTGQTKYKWLAHRIFEHTRDRVCDCPPPCPWDPPPGGCPAVCSVHSPAITGDAFVADMASIAGAYFAANEPFADTEPGAQLELGGPYQVRGHDAIWTGTPGAPVGQTFKIDDSPLVRLDLTVADNGGSNLDGTINVWTWNPAGYAATVSQTPLYRDAVKMDDGSLSIVQRFYLFVADLNTADTFFFEVSRPTTPFGLTGSSGAINWYPDGQLRVNGAFSSTADLWFRTYTLGKNGSTFTTRQHWVKRTYGQWGNPPKYFDIQPGVIVPDKLVLRSGYDKNAMHAVVNLVLGNYNHGELEPAALASLVDDGSVLITETAFPYWQYAYQDEDESMAMVRRYWGGTNGPRGDRTTVTHFGDYRKASVAWVDWNDIHGWQIAQQRRFYFVKDRFLLVRDRYRFPNAMRAAVGPVWHLADVHPTHGTNWYDIYNRQPVGNYFEVRNPERYALLYFVDRANYSVAEFREPNYLPGPACPVQPVQACEVLTASYTKPGDCRNSPPYVAYQRRVLDSTTNQNVWFDTLLWPHDSSLRPDGPTPAATKVTKKFDDGTAVALEVRVPVGGSPDEVWTVVDNPNRITLTASSGDLLTDARYLVSRRTPGDPASNYLLAKEATRVRVGTTSDSERIDYTWTVANTVELGGNYPACPAVSADCPLQFCVGPEGSSQCGPAIGSCTIGSDTGMQVCQGPDTPAECPAGQTIHIMYCPCECMGQGCGSRTSLTCQ